MTSHVPDPFAFSLHARTSRELVGPYRALIAAVLVAALGACSRGVSVTTAPSPAAGIRVVVPATGATLDFDAMIAQVAQADVVLFGEQHDDPATHRLERDFLDAIGRSGRPVILSLEMFERDVQPVLDNYLAGRVSEADFLARSRPWDRYASDYRGLIELARANHWPVVAANVPRPLAAAIGRRGLAALDTLTRAERKYTAGNIVCPDDDYRARFMEEMHGHTAGGAAPQPGDTLPTAIADRFYFAQCVKDETMAESIVEARRAAPPNAIVVQFDGAFHSDFHEGTAARVERREPVWKVLVVTAVPVADPATGSVQGQEKLADFVVFTRKPAKS